MDNSTAMPKPIRFDYRTDNHEEYIKKMMKRWHKKDYVVRKILDTMTMDWADTDNLMKLSAKLDKQIASWKLKEED